MLPDPPAALARLALFRHVAAEDRERLGAISKIRHYERTEQIFGEGDPPDYFIIVIAGQAKVFKRRPTGADVILAIFGPGELLGGVAVYGQHPYPASATALEPTECLCIPSRAFFDLLEKHPSLVRGLLSSLIHRQLELTTRLSELAGGRVEARLARLFLRLADQLGRPERGGTFVPLNLTRQELADLTGTTVETSIRIMSRWSKDQVLVTDKDGFVIVDRMFLESVAES